MNWYAVMCNTEVRFRAHDPDDADAKGRSGIVYGECRAVERIVGAGFEAFTPVLRRSVPAHRYSKARRELHEPMFRGYCFARWDEAVFSHGRLRAWPEVWDVVRMGEAPRVITEKEIEAVRAIEAAMATAVVTGDSAELLRRVLKVGDRVKHKGVFWGFIGTVEAEQRGRARVLFDGVLSGRAIDIPAEELELVR